MYANVESIQGKHLGDAADTVTQQLKYVIDEMGELRTTDEEPLDPNQAQHLKELLGNVGKIKSNVRYLLMASGLRLDSVEKGIRLNLMEAGLAS